MPPILALLLIASGGAAAERARSAADATVFIRTVANAHIDLAILYVSVPNLPYVALGDSDVVIAGQPVEALGYPFGRRVEVGLPVEARNVVPEITTTPGAISATRNGEAGERRYLQVTNTVNPGNSGGPIVDRDGFAVGVITMKLRDAAGIAFAIPVNQAKDFLELHGVDQQLP